MEFGWLYNQMLPMTDRSQTEMMRGCLSDTTSP